MIRLPLALIVHMTNTPFGSWSQKREPKHGIMASVDVAGVGVGGVGGRAAGCLEGVDLLVRNVASRTALRAEHARTCLRTAAFSTSIPFLAPFLVGVGA